MSAIALQERMGRQISIVPAKGVVAIAGPAVVGGIIRHGGAHRIEFNVALAGQQIGLGLYQRGFVAAVP